MKIETDDISSEDLDNCQSSQDTEFDSYDSTSSNSSSQVVTEYTY